MADKKQVVVLANPYSGKGENRKRVAALAGALEHRGIPTHECWDLEARAQLLADPHVGETYRCIVSAGGDGSMAAVVNDLQQGGDTTRAPIAMLPMGNENLFAQEFGHHRGIKPLADAIDRMQTRTIDVGEVGGRLFTLMASAGFDSEVVGRVDRWRHQTHGNGLRRVSRLSYAKPIGAALTGYRYPMITLTANGQTVTGAHAFVFNIGRYGGGLRIGAHADPADGELDWIVFTKPGLVSLARYGVSVLLRGHLKHQGVRHGKASSIEIASDSGAVPIQADGDPAGAVPSTIRVRSQAMCVVVAS